MCKLPMYIDKVVNQLIETFCNNTKRYEVEVYFFLERDMAACMQYAFHMIETREQNKHHFSICLRSGILPFYGTCYTGK